MATTALILALAASLFPARAQFAGPSIPGAISADDPAAPITGNVAQAFLIAGAGFVPAAAPAAAPAARAVAASPFRNFGSGSAGYVPGAEPAALTVAAQGDGSSSSSSNGATPAATKTANTTSNTSSNSSGSDNQDLQKRVIAQAYQVAKQINSTGGYRFDGTNDCYGFVRRVWNPILSNLHDAAMPVDDYPDSKWARITDWKQLKPGDALATAQGHHWGGNWHGGLFYGMKGSTPTVFDDTPNPRGASIHSNEVFLYYYVPTHKLLAGQ